jgi:uncharacterized membrane protein YfcA
MSPDLILVISLLILTLAIFGQCLFGFGSGLIAIPTLGLLIGLKDAVTLSLIVQMVSVIFLIRIYDHIDWKLVLPVIWGLIPGTLLGVYLLTILDEAWIRWALTVFIIGYLIRDFFFKDKKFPFLRHQWSGFGVGSIGGIIQGLIGTGGPPLVIYLNEISLKPDAFRAALLLWLCVVNVVRLVISMNTVLFSPQVIQTSFFAIPLLLLAMWAANHVRKKLNEKLYARAIQFILVGSVVGLMMK